MCGGSFELWALVRAAVAVGGTAYAVKVMDDGLDEPETVSAARVAYALAALAVAAAADRSLALAGFFASYAWGMAAGPRAFRGGDRLPSGLFGWMESLAALALAGWVAGPRPGLAALCAAGAVQCADDVLDGAADRRAGARSVALRWGRPAAAMLGAGLGLLGLAADAFTAGWLLAGGVAASWLTRPAAAVLSQPRTEHPPDASSGGAKGPPRLGPSRPGRDQGGVEGRVEAG